MDSYDKDDSNLQQEIEVLQEIYINELQVDRDSRGCICRISLQLHPATGDQIDQKWVCLTLILNPSPLYPDDLPEIQIKNPRGLSEEYVFRLQGKLEKLAEDKRGECMLFELIELAKDSLTQGNLPHGECVICKDGFSEEEHFTKTRCYHYFHCHCLLRYIKYSEQEIEEDYQAAVRMSPHVKIERKKVLCPVCREPLTYDQAQLQKHPEQNDLDPCSIIISQEVRLIQKKMAALFKKQQFKGGIIDLQAEKDRYLVPSSLSASVGLMVNGSSKATDDCLQEASDVNEESDEVSGLLLFRDSDGDYVSEGWNTGSSGKSSDLKVSKEETTETLNISNQICVSNDRNKRCDDRPSYKGKNYFRQSGGRFRNGQLSQARDPVEKNYNNDRYERHHGDVRSEQKSQQRIPSRTYRKTDENRWKWNDGIGDNPICDVLEDESNARFGNNRESRTKYRDADAEKTYDSSDRRDHPVYRRNKASYDNCQEHQNYNGNRRSDRYGDLDFEHDDGHQDLPSYVSSSGKNVKNEGEQKAGAEVVYDRGPQTYGRGNYGRSRKRYPQHREKERREHYKNKDISGTDKLSTASIIADDRSDDGIKSVGQSRSGVPNSDEHKPPIRGRLVSSASRGFVRTSGSRSGRGSGARYRSHVPNNVQADAVECRDRTTEADRKRADASGRTGYGGIAHRQRQTSSVSSIHQQQQSREHKTDRSSVTDHPKSDQYRGCRMFNRRRFRGDQTHDHHNHHPGYRNDIQKSNDKSMTPNDKQFDSKDAVS